MRYSAACRVLVPTLGNSHTPFWVFIRDVTLTCSNLLDLRRSCLRSMVFGKQVRVEIALWHILWCKRGRLKLYMELLETCKPAAEGGALGSCDTDCCRISLGHFPGFLLFLQSLDTGFISPAVFVSAAAQISSVTSKEKCESR